MRDYSALRQASERLASPLYVAYANGYWYLMRRGTVKPLALSTNPSWIAGIYMDLANG